mmetsp:Transcript_144712/g.463738  ORF Transcript_144712/g.463738 Transcript_144712/m.463738 type:complete len:201 (+) Transcript_144712:588-1190(+)
MPAAFERSMAMRNIPMSPSRSALATKSVASTCSNSCKAGSISALSMPRNFWAFVMVARNAAGFRVMMAAANSSRACSSLIKFSALRNSESRMPKPALLACCTASCRVSTRLGGSSRPRPPAAPPQREAGTAEAEWGLWRCPVRGRATAPGAMKMRTPWTSPQPNDGWRRNLWLLRIQARGSLMERKGQCRQNETLFEPRL